MELSRSQFPQNGWVFHQAVTGWSAPTPLASTFDQTCDLIIRHRLGNPAITKQYNLATDFNSVAAELESFTRTRLGLPGAFEQPLRPGERVQSGRCCGQ